MSDSLEDRVAALEAAVERLAHPFVMAEFPRLDEAELERFRAAVEEAAKRGPHCILPSSLTVLDPETVRALLRECVTVVKPGEVLVVRDRNWTPNQMRELQELVDSLHREGDLPFKVFIVPGEELGVVELDGAPERA